MAGVASTIAWFLNHSNSKCNDIWRNSVDSNAGPKSKHHRCPASAGTGECVCALCTLDWAPTPIICRTPAMIILKIAQCLNSLDSLCPVALRPFVYVHLLAIPCSCTMPVLIPIDLAIPIQTDSQRQCPSEVAFTSCVPPCPN